MNWQTQTIVPALPALLVPQPLVVNGSSDRNGEDIPRRTKKDVLPRSLSSSGCGPVVPPNQYLTTTNSQRAIIPIVGHDQNAGSCNNSTRFQPFERVAPVPPPCHEESIPSVSERSVLSLGIGKDKEEQSDALSFVRSELVEAFRASGKDVVSRINNKRVVYHQVGIRCIFCAHLPRTDRGHRAATFPRFHASSRASK